jgi:tetratricopeptide (TPR) repeat protein
MAASRTSCFRFSESVALALSISFLCGQFVLADPAPGAGGEAKPGAEVGTPAGSGAATESRDQAKSPESKPDDTAGAWEASGNREETKLTEAKLHEIGVFHWNLSKKYSKDGDLDLAQTELDLAVMNWPDLKIAHRDLCLVSAMRLNLLRSLAEFMMTVGLCDAVPMNEEESCNLTEDGMTKHYKKGLFYARQQDWPKTINELELAAYLMSDDFAVQRALAYAYANQGNFAKAEEHYRATFDLAPHDGSSRADLAYFLAQKGKVQEAVKEMEEAVKSQPKAAAYHVDLGWMAENQGDLNTASRELQEAITLSPGHADLWAHLGRLFERKGEKPRAVEAYAKAISLNPALAEVKQALTKLQESSSAQPVELNSSPRIAGSGT